MNTRLESNDVLPVGMKNNAINAAMTNNAGRNVTKNKFFAIMCYQTTAMGEFICNAVGT
jgi:hypothetical protein